MRKYILTLTICCAPLGAMASTAAASSGQFLHSKYPNSAHAVQTTKHIFTIDGQGTECKTAELNGSTQNGPASELTLTPTFKECTAFGFGGATIAVNGCTYRLTQPEGFADNWAGGFAIKCPEGKKLVIASGVLGSECKAEIGEQTLAAGVTYENDTTNGEVDLALNLTGIKATKVTDNGLCPLSGTGTANNGTYEGPFTFKAASGGNLAVAG
ncbi:MAG TPA: hypothetical protein VFU16_03290 [Solirubrobacterales bacterium]|nr:hypothetical protein [Solirubrobacterales bacterium]